MTPRRPPVPNCQLPGNSGRCWLGDIQAELEHNQRIIADFGKQQGNASWQDGEFKAANGVKFLACGRGQSPRGLRDREARPDYIVIDDLDDDELCRNEKRVHDITDWVKEALFGALDVGRGRFIMVGNLISKNSVLANLTKTKGVHVSVIKAIDKNGPLLHRPPSGPPRSPVKYSAILPVRIAHTKAVSASAVYILFFHASIMRRAYLHVS